MSQPEDRHEEEQEQVPRGFAFLRALAVREPNQQPEWRDRFFITLAAALVILPFLGSYGLWDPWETHYGEVGRQILERNDWISTWWGSHWQNEAGQQEGTFFFSKPILLKWMMAMGMTIFGYSELGIRIGVALTGMLGVIMAYSMGTSVFRRRTGWVMAFVLLTSPYWFFLSRQAQTDMPFVGMMTIGLCFFMMGVFGKDRYERADRLTYGLTFGWIGLLVIPQFSLLIAGLARWRGATDAMTTAMSQRPWALVIPAILLLGAVFVFAFGFYREHKIGGGEEAEKTRRKWAWRSLAVLWVPLIVLLPTRLVMVATAASDRAMGMRLMEELNGWFVWGTTQTALYLTCIGVAVYFTLSRPILDKRRIYLLGFYAFIGLATLAKGLLGFLLPGAVIFFYIVFTRQWRMLKEVELLRGIPVFIAVAFPWYAAMLIRHTHGFWQRFFVHDHFRRLASGVHQLTTGSFEHFIKWLGYGLFPWVAFVPAALARFLGGRGLERDDDESRAALFLMLWAVIAFTLFTLSSTKFHHYIFPVVPPLALLVAITIDDALDAIMSRPWPLFLLALPIVVLITWDLAMDPQTFKNLFTYKYDREWDNEAWDREFRLVIWLAALPALVGTIGLLARSKKVRRASVMAIVATGLITAFYGLNVYMPRISDTWSQQGLWDRYYHVCDRIEGPPNTHRFKRYCEQPVIAFKLNWRGETFYSQNEVIPVRSDDDWDTFVKQIEDRTFYGIMEYGRYRGEFQRKLSASRLGTSCVVYRGNLQFVLAKVPCAEDDPDRQEIDEN